MEDLEFDPEDAEECDDLDDFLHGSTQHSQPETLHWDLVSLFALFQTIHVFWLSRCATAMCIILTPIGQ